MPVSTHLPILDFLSIVLSLKGKLELLREIIKNVEVQSRLTSSGVFSRVKDELISSVSTISSITIIMDGIESAQENFSIFIRQDSIRSYVREIVTPAIRLQG
jgi:hypothetical protein